MKTAVYEDYKYMMQDTGKLFIGAKYTYRELVENPDTNFKFRAIIEHYLFKSVEPDSTLESDLYYMTADSFAYRTYDQLRASVKVNMIVEKRSLFGRKKHEYKEVTMPLRKLVSYNLAQKKAAGFVIEELILSKLGLMSFVV